MSAHLNLIEDSTYLDKFSGKFYGVLKWTQLDELWSILKESKDASWYVYAIGEAPPIQITSNEDLITFINKIDELLRREHDEDYCGIVYADDLETPNFVKIFDPNNIGTSCSIASKGPLPGWILSKIKPVNLPDAMKPTANRRRWWQKIFK